MVFVLDLDDMILFDLPSKNFFGIEDPDLKAGYVKRLRQGRKRVRHSHLLKALRISRLSVAHTQLHKLIWLGPR